MKLSDAAREGLMNTPGGWAQEVIDLVDAQHRVLRGIHGLAQHLCEDEDCNDVDPCDVADDIYATLNGFGDE